MSRTLMLTNKLTNSLQQIPKLAINSLIAIKTSTKNPYNFYNIVCEISGPGIVKLNLYYILNGLPRLLKITRARTGFFIFRNIPIIGLIDKIDIKLSVESTSNPNYGLVSKTITINNDEIISTY